MTRRSRRPDPRGRGTAAALEGAFAALWLVWAGPTPAGLAAALQAAALVAALTAAAGAVLAWRHRHDRTALNDPTTRRGFRRVSAVEFGALATGAVLLGMAGQGRWLPVWTAAVVGAHFLALGRLLGNRLMRPLGLLLVGSAVAGVAVGLATTAAPALVVGTASGSCLLVTAALTLTGRGSGSAAGHDPQRPGHPAPGSAQPSAWNGPPRTSAPR